MFKEKMNEIYMHFFIISSFISENKRNQNALKTAENICAVYVHDAIVVRIMSIRCWLGTEMKILM